MLIDLTDTSTGNIRAALTRARDQLGGPTTGVVLNLIIVTDEASQHDAVVEPLLVPDTPVVTWWPGAGPAVPSAAPLGALAQRRVTDAAGAGSPEGALAALAAGYQPGDTDLAWTRSTTWRTLLAATLDQSHAEITGGRVLAEEHNPTADLIAAWLSSRLAVPVSREVSAGPGITEVIFTTGDGDISISRPDGRNATLSRPDQPQRSVALHRRDTAELLAEELRRLDPDEIYHESLIQFAAGAAAEGS
jgi:glucose-6-phosphate dehydrogenase assembly protein OpcA